MSEKKAEEGQRRPQKPQFSKRQLVACKEFAGRRDPLEALLAEGRGYTKEEAQRLLDEFLNRKV